MKTYRDLPAYLSGCRLFTILLLLLPDSLTDRQVWQKTLCLCAFAPMNLSSYKYIRYLAG